MIEANFTPVYITFEDAMGRTWQALALVAPLSAEDMNPVHFAETEDLQLRIRKVRIVRR